MMKNSSLAFLILFCITCIPIFGKSQSCSNWLKTTNQLDAVAIGDLDISGTQITIEATFNRTATYSGGRLYAGDIVSKHNGPGDCNYLLRPSSAEITTSNGYFITPAICDIQLNKTYHVAMTYDGTTLKFYRNGFLMSQVAASGTLYLNNWQTRIGDLGSGLLGASPENMVGFINEVRIWNVVRTQAQIQGNMGASLPSPATQTGLLAYYTFDNLLNKQGNTLWNGTLVNGAQINQTNTSCNFIADSCSQVVTPVTPTFTTPDTVCINTPVNITNTTTSATTYYWNFCTGNLNTPPTGTNLGNIGGKFSTPVFMDYVNVNNNWYGFVVNHNPGGITRLDFGNSLLNTPTAVSLGNPGGVLPTGPGSEGIQVVQNEGHWYALVVGGSLMNGVTPRIVKIDFGASITNTTPTGTNWGNIGNLSQPIDLHVFQENNNWYGFTVNAENNTLTRFDFTNSFNNTPTATNFGNIGNLSYPTGVYAINDNGFWRVFIVNDAAPISLTRLDFGSSLLNTPTAVNLGNPNNGLSYPRDITLMKFCGQIFGFVINGEPGYSDIAKLDFHNDLTSTPTITSVGNSGNLNFGHCLSKLFRVNDNVYSFICNAGNNTLTRLQFAGCTNASIASSTAQYPAPVTYNAPGTYNINLTVDDGLPTQASFCKQVVVLPALTHTPTQTFNICAGSSIKIGTGVKNAQYTWNNGATTDSITVNTAGTYWVQTGRYGCSNTDTIIVTTSSCVPPIAQFITPDTVCVNTSVTIKNTSTNASSFYWNFCTGNLNAPPTGVNFTNYTSSLTSPVYIDYVTDNGNYYGFLTDNYTGRLFRLDFGASLLNTPSLVSLGTLGGVIPMNAEGIQVIKNEGKWYAIIVGGDPSGGNTSQVVKVEFGASITNTSPIATNWGNLGNLNYPHDLYVFSDAGGIWYGLTVNTGNNTITRFNFTNSFSNTPTALNLGNVGNLNAPTGLHAINDNGNWYAFITNANSNSLTRLDFGNSLLNTPTGVNLGNIGNIFHGCWDIYIVKYCGDLLGYVINADQNYNDIIKLNFNNNITSTPTAVSFGNIGNLKFPHCLSKIFRAGPDLYTFIPNVANQTISRLSFAGCNNASIPNSTLQNPPAITYNTPGTYNINLTIDDGLATQSSFCKQVVVLPALTHTPTQTVTLCTNDSVKIGNHVPYTTYSWNDGSTTDSIVVKTPGTYWVQISRYGCSDRDSFVVVAHTPADFHYGQDACNPLTVQFFSDGANLQNPYWAFGNGNTNTTSLSPVNIYPAFGNYVVKFGVLSGACKDTITKTITIAVTQSNIITTADTTICFNSTKQLHAQPALSYCWSPTTYLDNAYSANPTTSTPQTITYYLNAAVPGNNLITNGDFSSGNTGFTSDYSYGTPNTFEGQYFVGPNPNAWNGGLGTCADHTTGNGNMLIINGAPTANTRVYTTTVAVTPNTNYAFSTWVDNVNPGGANSNPPILQFSINGNNIGNAFQAGYTSCVWQQFYTIWNSGNATSATISVVNQNTIRAGNDFALDDISFAPVNILHDSVIISVDTPIVKTNNDTTICKGASVQLQAKTANTWSWLPATGLSNTTISNPIATPLASTQYIVTGTTLHGCMAKDTVNIKIDSVYADFHYQQDICNPLSVQFVADGRDALSPYWAFGDGNTTTGTPSPVNTYAAYGNYIVKYGVQSPTCKDTITKTIAINVTKSNIILTPDTTICFNATKQLHTQPALRFCWSPTTYLDNPNSANPITSALQKTTYYFTAEVLGNNLIVNGDFSNGNTSFTSEYQYSTSGIPAAVYYVGANPQAWNPGMTPCHDHTTGSGNMLLVNGASTANVKVWSQTVNVTPNTNYAFSTWLQHITTVNPAQLQFSINGNAIGNIFQANSTSCVWDQFYNVWNSGNNTTATISIVNMNTAFNGNDFALDDISFAPVNILRDSVIVSVDTPIVKTNNDTTICTGTSVQLQAKTASTWLWSPATGLSNATISNPVATPTANTEYIVTGTTINGCMAKDTVNISLYPVPTIITNHNLLVCPAATAQLSANSTLASYTWSPATTLNNTTIYNPVATPTQNTVYTVKGKDANNCNYSDSVKVDIRAIHFAASPSEAICNGSSITLMATGGDTYQWSPAGSLNNATSATPQASPDTTTLYTVHAAENTCLHDTTMQVVITVNPSPTITAQKTNDINCTSPTAKLQAEGAVSYAWLPTTGLDNATIANPVSGADTTTTYYVTGTNEYGCSNTTNITVYVTAAGKVTFVVPNAFTPNADGRNDCFGVKTWGGAVIEEFSIFNRWGQRVFSTNNTTQCWDGRYNGQLADPGTYVYMIRAKTICGEIKRSGTVILIR